MPTHQRTQPFLYWYSDLKRARYQKMGSRMHLLNQITQAYAVKTKSSYVEPFKTIKEMMFHVQPPRAVHDGKTEFAKLNSILEWLRAGKS